MDNRPTDARGLTRSDYRLFAAGAVLTVGLCARILPARAERCGLWSSPPSALPSSPSSWAQRGRAGRPPRPGHDRCGPVRAGQPPELFISVFALRAGCWWSCNRRSSARSWRTSLGARHRVRRRWSPARDPSDSRPKGRAPLPSSSSWRRGAGSSDRDLGAQCAGAHHEVALSNVAAWCSLRLRALNRRIGAVEAPWRRGGRWRRGAAQPVAPVGGAHRPARFERGGRIRLGMVHRRPHSAIKVLHISEAFRGLVIVAMRGNAVETSWGCDSRPGQDGLRAVDHPAEPVQIALASSDPGAVSPVIGGATCPGLAALLVVVLASRR